MNFKKILSVFLILLFSSFSGYAGGIEDTTADVICNIIGYIWGLGVPILTVVIIGAALLAIFGKMPWPALVALGVFMGVFFGAKTIVETVIPATDTNVKNMLEKCGKQN
ncbi:MAG: TrbC/VirB2 family protein [Wolbachia endosymbiont of Tyrophagus putrescentiae]|nr:TrbC/VirB2 family protein [Wolbachia endosymbiont of Tyrophagus putrescentiae]